MLCARPTFDLWVCAMGGIWRGSRSALVMVICINYARKRKMLAKARSETIEFRKRTPNANEKEGKEEVQVDFRGEREKMIHLLVSFVSYSLLLFGMQPLL